MMKTFFLSLMIVSFAFTVNAQTDTLARQFPCGLDKTYLLQSAIDTTTNNLVAPTYPTGITSPQSFPTSAIDTCGKFVLYYEDLIPGTTAGGFNDPTFGGLRRANLCAMLTYIQSVFDFSSIPSNDLIRIHIDTSFVIPPIAYPLGFIGRASPYFVGNGPAIVNGFLNQYVTTGTDPISANGYHAHLQMNFTNTAWGINPNGTYSLYDFVFQEDYSIPYANCHVDQRAVFLHEMTHALGLNSFLNLDNSGLPASTIGNNVFSPFDTIIRKGTVFPSVSLNKLIVGPANNPSVNPLYANDVTALRNLDIWMNDQAPPNNVASFSDRLQLNSDLVPSLLQHIAFTGFRYVWQSRYSPGYKENYVMGPSVLDGQMRNDYSKGELSILHSLGYNYTSSFQTANAVILANHTPYASKLPSKTWDETSVYFNDTIHHDYTMTNDVGSSLPIHLYNDPTLTDADGDHIYILDSTLVNIMGCGNGNNNHAQLTISDSGKTITFTPRAHFYGRAQFCFNIWDKKEKGSYMVYTIDVAKGTNVLSTPGTNIVINGGFEEGSEVKLVGTAENIDNAVANSTYEYIGNLMGQQYADGEFFCFNSNPEGNGGGTVIGNSEILCNGTNYTDVAGSQVTSFPGLSGWVMPNAATGNRYNQIQGLCAMYLRLDTNMQTCHKYTLEFDAYTGPFDTGVSGGTAARLVAGFVTTPTITVPYLGATAIPPFVDSFGAPVAGTAGWQHISIPFHYCTSDSSSVFCMYNPQLYYGNQGFGVLIDNVSIVEDLNPPPFTISLSQTNIGGCLTQLQVTANDTECKTTYAWSPAAGLSCTDCANPQAAPTVTTTYHVIVNDGCHTLEDSITVTPAFNDLTVTATSSVDTDCAGTPITLDAYGADTYTWFPAGTVTCSNPACSEGTATPTVSTTYTVIGINNNTGACGIGSVNVFVFPSVITITPQGSTTICGSGSVVLDAPTGISYQWYRNNSTISGATNSTYTATLAGTYSVAVNFGPCAATSQPLVVTVSALPTIAVTGTTTICTGSCTTLTASGADTYVWSPATGLSATNVANPSACPTVTTTYTVTGTNATTGCSNTATVTVTVAPIPTVSAGSNVTICQGTSTTLTATGASTYTWAPATGLSCTNCANPSASPTATTTYTVTGTSAAGCVNMAAVTVSVTPSPSITGGTSQATCQSPSTGQTNPVQLSASGATSYTWTPATGLSASNIANPIANPSVTTTYTVVGTANGCPSNAVTVTITVLSSTDYCACNTFAGQVFNALGQSGTINSNVPSGNYYIPNDVTLQSAVTIADATVLMKPAITVTLDPSSHVIIEDSHLFGCEGMWHGMVATIPSSGTTGSVQIGDQTLIEDADTAGIEVMYPSAPAGSSYRCYLDSVVLNRNYIGVKLVNYSDTYPFFVMNTVFTTRNFSNFPTGLGYPYTWPHTTGTTGLKKNSTFNAPGFPYNPSFNVDNPNAGGTSIPYQSVACKNGIPTNIGVMLVNAGSTTGNPPTYTEVQIGNGADAPDVWVQNLFDSLITGIYAINSNFSSVNNAFIHMHKAATSTTSSGSSAGVGDGIYAINTDTSQKRRIQVYTPGGAYHNQFWDCVNAVEGLNYYNMKGQHASMFSNHTTASPTSPSGTYGYKFSSIKYNYFDMRYDTVTNISNCISFNSTGNLQGNTTGGTIIVDSNLVQAHYGSVVPSPNNKFVSFGITLQNVLNNTTNTGGGPVTTPWQVHVDYNHVHDAYRGIFVNNFKVPRVTTYGNYVSVVGDPAHTASWAINHTNCYQDTVYDNNIQGYGLGVSFDSIRAVLSVSNRSTTIKCNTEDSIGRGFEFQFSNLPMNWHHNTMQANGRGYVLNGSIIGQQGTNLVPMGNIWKGYWDQNNFRYQTFTIGYNLSLSSAIYVNTSTATNPSQNWGNPSFVPNIYYVAVSPPPPPYGSIVPVSTLDTAHCPITLPAYYLVYHGYEQVATNQLTYPLDQNESYWIDQKATYEDILLDSTLVDSSAVLSEFGTMVAGTRFEALNNIENMLSDGDVSSAGTAIDAMPSTYSATDDMTGVTIWDDASANTIVQNYIDFYKIYINFLNGSMSSDDTTNVLRLASLCPNQNGTIVFQARALYSEVYNDLTTWNDDSCILSRQKPDTLAQRHVQPGVTGSDVLDQQYSLHPNPSNGNIYLRQKYEDDSAVRAEILDVEGREIYRNTLFFNQQNAHIIMQGLPYGLYLLKLEDSRGRIFILKFVINQ